MRHHEGRDRGRATDSGLNLVRMNGRQEMSNITLTASAHSSLLSLQGTQSLMNRTTGRLTTGLKVSSAIDDAVSYFQAKGLSDRADDFNIRKGEIDQGISSLTAAVNGTSVADTILKQMKGIVNSVRTADASTRGTLGAQFTDLVDQLNSAVTDASYQGLNLVASTTTSLTVSFSQGTAASLSVAGTDLRTSSLITGGAVSNGTCAVNVFLSASGLSLAALAGFSSLLTVAYSPTAVLDTLSATLDASISTVRSTAAKLGGNVTFLNTRLEFTKCYVNTMTEGAGKLTLADLNEEGANLMALQTRQQIGTQSLSIAGQQQQAILSLLH